MALRTQRQFTSYGEMDFFCNLPTQKGYFPTQYFCYNL